MNKLASNTSLQDMIRGVINRATEKLAADEAQMDQQVRKSIAAPEVTEDDEDETTGVTDSTYVEKLASAVDYIASNVDKIAPEEQGVLTSAIKKLAEEGSPAGAGKGPGALEVSKSIGGTQAYKKDKPKTEDAAASQAGKPMSTAGLKGSKTQMDNNMHKAPGQGSGSVPKAKYPAKGPLVAGPSAGKAKTAAEIAKEHILSKLAGEDVLKAKIDGGGTVSPLAGKGQLKSTKAGESSPRQAGDANGGFGNEARKHIASNTAAMGYSKKDAKGPVKTQLKEVLDEPALSPKTDSKINENLRNAGKAGVKIAAARQLLQKIAQEGCQCEGGECQYCQLKGAIKAKSSETEKTANAMMGYGGAPGGGAGAMPPPMPMGGMSAMAEAGASADGCACGNTGECRVCKLKAALAAAKAPGGGAVEKDSMGDAVPMGGIY